MKKFLITTIYSSLAITVFGYLFNLMHWTNGRELMFGGFWLHVASYLAYSLLVKDKDERIVYPFLFLIVGLVLAQINALESIGKVGFSIALLVAYIAFHLFTKNYLSEIKEPKLLRPIKWVCLGMFVVGVLFKIMHWPYADVLLIVGLSTLGFILILSGIAKNLSPKK